MPQFTSLRAFLAASGLGGATFAAGAEAIYDGPGSIQYNDASWDKQTTGRFVVAYRKTDYFAVVGTVSGNTITFGTPVTVYSGTTNGPIECDFDPSTAGRIMFGYSTGTTHNSGTPKCRLGTVSGSGSSATISMHGEASMPSGPGHPNSTWAAAQRGWAFSKNGSYIFMAAYDQSSANQGRSYRLSTSGNSITGWGYLGQHDSNGRDHHITTNLAVNDSALMTYSANGGAGICRVLTGGIGSSYTYEGNVASVPRMRFMPNNTSKFVVAYTDQNAGNYGRVRVGTVSGNTITYDTEYTFASYGVENVAIDFDYGTDVDTFVLTFNKQGVVPNGRGMICTVDNSNVITIGDPHTLNDPNNKDRGSIICDPHTPGAFVTVWDDATTNEGTAVVGSLG